MTDRIEGVFILEKEAKIGTGHTEKKVVQKMYCLATELESGEIEVRYLDGNDKPLDITERFAKQDFVHRFTFQPYYFERKEAERQKKLLKHIVTAEEHARKNELHSAEYEYKNALRLDEEDLRANFGIGNVYLQMGEKNKAKDIFTKISKIDAIFEEQNKHFFNECGIQLRKQELYEEAIEYYDKAVNLSPQDEHLFFNLARAHFEKGDVAKANEYIAQAMAIKPDFEEGKTLQQYMAGKQQLPASPSAAEAAGPRPPDKA
jgi:tetratricopeptide (TPR) repeat protein